jgi:hypothetical protein
MHEIESILSIRRERRADPAGVISGCEGLARNIFLPFPCRNVWIVAHTSQKGSGSRRIPLAMYQLAGRGCRKRRARTNAGC